MQATHSKQNDNFATAYYEIPLTLAMDADRNNLVVMQCLSISCNKAGVIKAILMQFRTRAGLGGPHF
jgi:hypothetical protein